VAVNSVSCHCPHNAKYNGSKTYTIKGIVTRFKVKAHPIGQVWGGSRIYDPSQDNALFAALHSFTKNGASDPKAAIIHTNLVLIGGITSHLVYYFYDGPTPPTTGPFADFLSIPALVSNTSIQSYPTLVSQATAMI
jgi:hypothetical protein